MAQAARLSLRMQKELKLLLSDPPHGASFPLLSAAGDAANSSSSPSSSLTTIDAEIEGPEGTVYSGGIFKIRIQIPERYPFQPPVVTFATPIYHPNIDNGGRICLDILNLPPKGAWQPSLNVSTVITSIGLLLSEPNPDDGLMCEASREFKYNRQAFDLKARTMTEKYAKTKTSDGIFSNNQATEQTLEHRLTGDIEIGHEIKADSCTTNVCKKLSINQVSDPLPCTLDTKKLNMNEVHSVGDNKFRKKQKLSLSSLSQPKQSMNDQQEKVFRCTGSRRLSLEASAMPRNQEKCKDENIDQSEENLPSNLMKPEFTKQGRITGGRCDTDLNKGKCKVEELCDHGSDNKQQQDPSLTVIVLDSDDESDEEDRSRCRRSKLSLLSKRPIKL